MAVLKQEQPSSSLLFPQNGERSTRQPGTATWWQSCTSSAQAQPNTRGGCWTSAEAPFPCAHRCPAHPRYSWPSATSTPSHPV